MARAAGFYATLARLAALLVPLGPQATQLFKPPKPSKPLDHSSTQITQITQISGHRPALAPAIAPGGRYAARLRPKCAMFCAALIP